MFKPISEPTMSTTTVKDLPKELLIADNLKGELLTEHNLKHTEATEKNPLPTAEDLKQEKTHQNIITGKEFKEISKIKLKGFSQELKVSKVTHLRGQKQRRSLYFQEKRISRQKRQSRVLFWELKDLKMRN